MVSKIILGLILVAFVVLASAAYEKKPGDCPPPVEISICAVTCRVDDHCNGESKCCRTSCGGSVCIKPVTARVPKLLAEKRGSCPSRPTGPWVCSSRCAFDGDCRGSKKCCKNRCGATACMKPEA